MNIVISPYSQKLRYREGVVPGQKPDKFYENPKNYPHWPALIARLKEMGHGIIQIGVGDEARLNADIFYFNRSLDELRDLIHKTDLWISVDNFFQHLAWLEGKKGIVLFGKSDPAIFGHEENVNLFRNKKYFRLRQHWWWEWEHYDPNVFVNFVEVTDVVERWGHLVRRKDGYTNLQAIRET